MSFWFLMPQGAGSSDSVVSDHVVIVVSLSKTLKPSTPQMSQL